MRYRLHFESSVAARLRAAHCADTYSFVAVSFADAWAVARDCFGGRRNVTRIEVVLS